MKDLIKRSLLLGLGAASATKEKVDKVVRQLVKKRAITQKDGKWLADKVLKEISKHRKRLEELSKSDRLMKSAKALENKLVKRGRKAAKNILRKAEKELR